MGVDVAGNEGALGIDGTIAVLRAAGKRGAFIPLADLIAWRDRDVPDPAPDVAAVAARLRELAEGLDGAMDGGGVDVLAAAQSAARELRALAARLAT